MNRGVVGPGEDVEAWCTRCKMNLNHRVIAVTPQGIQRVHCLTCQGDHKYYPPKGDKPTESDRTRGKTGTASGGKTSRPQIDRSIARAQGEWTTIMKDLPIEALPRPYRVTESYRIGEFVEHPVFGTGRVLDVLGAERIEVIFKEGRKVMICNRNPQTPQES